MKQDITIENNKEIFRYLNPNSNDTILSMNNSDRINIMSSLKNYLLELRPTLNIGDDVTFGAEIEFENAKRNVIENYIQDNFPYRSWIVKDDRSLYNGGEINSPVLRDTEKTWIDLSNVCNVVKENAEVLENTSSHVHIGMQILGNNPKYWYNFALLWMTYEYIITRFLFGEYTTARENFVKYAAPISQDLIADKEILKKYSDYNTAQAILVKLNKTDEKRRSVNFRHIGRTPMIDYTREANKNTIEFRGGNGTFNAVIWQNYINVLVKLLEYAKSDNFNYELIERRLQIVNECKIPSNLYKYSQIRIEDAFEFADLIFTNNLDKIYFLKQYFKDMNVSTKPLTKVRI